jgi:hypothetical protein
MDIPIASGGKSPHYKKKVAVHTTFYLSSFTRLFPSPDLTIAVSFHSLVVFQRINAPG